MTCFPTFIYWKIMQDSLHLQNYIKTDVVKQALFERIMLDSPVDHVIMTSRRSDPQSARDVAEPDPLCYLFQCYSRLSQQVVLSTSTREQHYPTRNNRVMLYCAVVAAGGNCQNTRNDVWIYNPHILYFRSNKWR